VVISPNFSNVLGYYMLGCLPALAMSSFFTDVDYVEVGLVSMKSLNAHAEMIFF
jgi:hypothetical protein